jgi:hypothetical protein
METKEMSTQSNDGIECFGIDDYILMAGIDLFLKILFYLLRGFGLFILTFNFFFAGQNFMEYLSLFFLHSIYIIFYPFSSLSSYYDNLAF